MSNLLTISDLNPVRFFVDNYTQPDAYQTKQFDDYMFEDRTIPSVRSAPFSRIWQTTDIIYLQFTSTFDPITIELINAYGQTVIILSALNGLPDKNNPGNYAFEVSISLAGLQTGCYRLKGTFGAGAGQLIMRTDKQFISSDPIPNTILINYYNTRYFKDILFETGIQFQIRVQGYIDDDHSTRPVKQEQYRDQPYNNKILSSKSSRNVPVYLGANYGLPVDVTNLIEQIFECNTVTLNGKLYGLAEGSKVEYIEPENFRLRGLKLTLEPSLNRDSKIYSLDLNTDVPLFAVTLVDVQMFGDTGNQNNGNTVPVYNQQII